MYRYYLCLYAFTILKGFNQATCISRFRYWKQSYLGIMMLYPKVTKNCSLKMNKLLCKRFKVQKNYPFGKQVPMSISSLKGLLLSGLNRLERKKHVRLYRRNKSSESGTRALRLPYRKISKLKQILKDFPF